MTYIRPADKLLRHLNHIRNITRTSRQPPLNVEIDISNRCNLGCEWCHFKHTHTRGHFTNATRPDGYSETGDIMDTGFAVELTKELRDYGVRTLTFSGGGEPTVHPDFNEIITHAALPYGVYTNGCNIPIDRAALLKATAEWVYISLDAVSAEEYRQAKAVPPGMFNNALAGIDRLVKAKGKAIIGMGFLVGADNWGRAEAAVHLASVLNVDYVQFRPIIQYAYDQPGVLDEDTAWVPLFIRYAQKIGLDTNPRVQIDLQRFRDYGNWESHGYPKCYWSRMQTVITPDGRVWTCANKRGMAGECLGSVATESFGNLWERADIPDVDHTCRIMCRGHIPNQTLNIVLDENPLPHEDFV